MTYAPATLSDDFDCHPRMPSWVTGRGAETAEAAAFLSGAALSCLHQVLMRADVAQALLRERLALRAAEACVALSGRVERQSDLRDEVHLLRDGDRPGPAGAVYQMWQRAITRPVSAAALERAMPVFDRDQIEAWLVGGGAPVDQAARLVERVLADEPRAEGEALILADAVLARAFGWSHVTPLIAANLKARDLRLVGDDLRLACHRALAKSATSAVQLAADLARRVARLEAVEPKLRAKGASAVVEMFRTRDAIAPSVALRGVMSDRAARRICDRLVDLGAIEELTGRDSFRLYGV